MDGRHPSRRRPGQRAPTVAVLSADDRNRRLDQHQAKRCLTRMPAFVADPPSGASAIVGAKCDKLGSMPSGLFRVPTAS